MPAPPRDLAAPELWETSLQKSLARREGTVKTSVASIATTDSAPASGSERRQPLLASSRSRSDASHATAATARVRGAASEARAAVAARRTTPLIDRDLSDNEAWELSLGRSRARRRAAQLRFVPARTRAKRISLGTLVALTAAPAASLGDASVAPSLASAKTAPTTTTKHEILLRNGSSGRQVRLLQQALGVKVDGAFGPETEAAVIALQKSRGIEADGIVGPQTKAALAQGSLKATGSFATVASVEAEGSATALADYEAEGTESSAISGEVTEEATTSTEAGTEAVGSETEGALLGDVKALQGALHVEADGIFGPETEGAVIRYQKELKLQVDGIVGPETWGALGYKGRADLYPPASAVPASLGREETGANATTASVADASGAKQTTAAGGSAIRVLQEALGLPVDGVFGPETLTAVKSYQREHHLEVDGVVGPETWSALGYEGMKGVSEAHAWAIAGHHKNDAVAKAPAASHASATVATANESEPASSPGAATGHPVQLLQSLLHVSVDGEFGPATLAAVKRFQSEHGLEVDGVVGPATWAALGYHGLKELHPLAWALPHAAGSDSATAASGGGVSSSEANAQAIIQRVIDAANEIATRPYVYGGGHGSFISEGYDCSGSVSYALHGGGLLEAPEDSTGLESYGEPGPGRYITIYANAEHAWMTIDGRRYDTVALAEDGTRWSDTMASTAGFVVRHPDGL
jgi:peptidoglycan hydrolase-like protein with peptidoglycan-binding domain